ncbi:MAG: hypothetical protein AAGJ46_07090 [Planctomycetota bacterium]
MTPQAFLAPSRLAAACLAAAVVFVFADDAEAQRRAQRRAQTYNWHSNYAHYQYGQPVALVVPPNVNMTSDWSWGVGSTRWRRVDHQFGRNWPGPGPHGGPFQPTPVWPQDTDQYGVYYVRGPW